MPANNKADQFANYAILTTTESAINTLTFKKLETGISMTEKVAWVICRVEYLLNLNTAGQFNSDSDYCQYGLSVSSAFSNIVLSETTILDYNQMTRTDFGAAASGGFSYQPIIKDFSSLPGGGILVPPAPLYGYVKSSGCVAAQSVYARINYTLLTLSVDQYWELVEARRVLSS